MYDFKYEHFKNIYEFEKAVTTRPVNSVFSGDSDLSSHCGSKDFTNTESFEEADDLLKNGWNAQVEVMTEELRKFSEKIESPVRRQFKSVVGYAPCVPNAIRGVPKTMYATKLEKVKKERTMHLVFNSCGTAGVSAETLMKCGMTVLKLAMVLDKMKVRTKIDAIPKMSESSDGDALYGCTVGIKDYRQPFNLSKMAYPIAHVSFFRRHGFRWLETCPDCKNESFRRGYGRSIACADNHEMQREYFKWAGLDKDDIIYIDLNDCKRAGFDYKELARAKGINI